MWTVTRDSPGYVRLTRTDAQGTQTSITLPDTVWVHTRGSYLRRRVLQDRLKACTARKAGKQAPPTPAPTPPVQEGTHEH